MKAEIMRQRAARCRELARVAIRKDIRRQLRVWAEEFSADAGAIEKAEGGQRDDTTAERLVLQRIG